VDPKYVNLIQVDLRQGKKRQMNESPGARMRVGLTGLTMAEYFRDVEHQDVLLFIDNIFPISVANVG